jgi:hypothetical protein
VSLICKVIDIRPVSIDKRILEGKRVFFIIEDDAILFNNREKRIQKLKRTTIVADRLIQLK